MVKLNKFKTENDQQNGYGIPYGDDNFKQHQHHHQTWGQLWKTFRIYNRTRGLAKATLENYESSICDKFFGWLEGEDIPYTQSLTQEDIFNYIDYLQNEYDKATTVNFFIKTLRTFIYFGEAEGHLTFKPKINLMKRQRKIKETYTDEELERLTVKPNLDECSFAKYRNWVIVNFLIATGVRRKTLLAINIEDLDFDNRLISLQTTKNKKAHLVPMGNELAKILREYLSYRQGTGKDPLFITSYGDRIKYHTIHKTIARYNKKRGVEKTSIHLFRHTFAKTVVRNGMNAFKLQKLLDHSDIAMTEEYVNMFGTDLQENFDDFSPLASLKR